MSPRSSSPLRHAARLGKSKNIGSHAFRSRRTTVTLSPDSQEIVERFKSANGASTSAAIDQIIRRSEPKPSRLKEFNGFLVLSTPPDHPEDARRVTIEDIKQAEDDMDREDVERILYRDRKPAPPRRKPGARR